MIIKGDVRPEYNNNQINSKKIFLKQVRGDRSEEKLPEYVKWFSELGRNDTLVAGGKGANLGEMYQHKFPVPPGFVIIAKAYNKFLEKSGLDKKIYEILSRISPENTNELEEEANRIQKMIMGEEMPQDMKEEIIESYEHLNINQESLKGASIDALAILSKGREPPFVAVRSSATAEDGEAASFAGQNSTFLNVKGNTNIIEAVKGCWASLFTARSVYYRVKKGFKHEETAIAVVIQMMVNPEKSGVMFTKDPVKNTNNIVVESVFGLGEGIVSGMINPDHFEITPQLEIINMRLSEKKIAIVRNSSGKNETVKLTPERSEQQTLTNYEVKRLAQYGMDLEQHYKKPQDIEFAVDSGKIYIVQTRPITTLANRESQEKEARENHMDGEVIISGISASPGVGSGVVRIVHNLSELSKIKKGDVLVTEMTNPDMVVAMQKANAILTDEGGLTSHAAIVSREMGIPCIVGSKIATKTLKDGEMITIDGYTGRVYKGIVEGKKVEVLPIVETKTKIKVILDLPDYAQRAALTKAHGVGLCRMEGIIAESAKHPQYFLKNNKLEEYEEMIYRGVKKILAHFQEVWVRTSDIRSDEYENLEGAPNWKEANPMLGMHGIRASLKNPQLLMSELRALRRAAEKGGKTVGVMMPQIISPQEVRKVREMMEELGMTENIKLGIMVETPAAVQVIDLLCDEGIKFASFGTNDLTQFTLALDRGNPECQELYDEMHPAVIRQIQHVIKICKERGVETSICGQAGSRKEMAKILVEAGIDSISVNADAARTVSQYVKELEELRGHQQALTDHHHNEEALTDQTKKEEAIEYKKEEALEDKREKVEEEQVFVIDESSLASTGIIVEDDEPNPDAVSAQPVSDYSEYNVEVEEVVSVENISIIEEKGEALIIEQEKTLSYEDEILQQLSSTEEETSTTTQTRQTPEEKQEQHVFVNIF